MAKNLFYLSLLSIVIFLGGICLSSSVQADDEDIIKQIQQMKSVESLLPFLQNKDYAIRAAAATALGRLGDPQAVESLLVLLAKEGDSAVLIPLVLALGELEDARAVDPLLEMRMRVRYDNYLNDKVAYALTKIVKKNRNLQPLLSALQSNSIAVSEAAATVLDNIGWHPNKNQALDYFIAKCDWEKCAELGAAAVDRLVVLLGEDKWRGYRADIAIALGKINDPRAVEPLMAAAKKAEVSYHKVIEALGNLKAKQAEPIFVAALLDRRRAVRNSAAAALDNIGWLPKSDQDKAVYYAAKENVDKCVELAAVAIDPLLIALSDHGTDAREFAAKALVKIGTPAVEPLINFINKYNNYRGKTTASSDDIAVKEAAVEVLGDINDPRAIEPLIRWLQSDPSSQVAVIKALSKMKSSQAIEFMITALEQPESEVRKTTATALEQMGWRPSTDKEKAAYYIARQDLAECKKLGTLVVEPLIAILKNGNYYDVTHFVVKALGQTGDPRAIAPLIDCLSHPAPDNYDAAEALEGFGVSAVEPLLDAFKQLPPLSNGSGSYPNWGRPEIAIILGHIGDKRAIPLLAANLQDWSARHQIVEVLYSLGWEPQSEREQIYCLINKKEKDHLSAVWEKAQKILLEDVESNNPQVISYALYTFIALGREDMVPTLIEILNARGTAIMAEAYANCGHKALARAAAKWAAEHGYYFLQGNGASPVQWGSW